MMDVLKSIEKSKRKHFTITGSRIRCTLTGHELPASSDALLSYTNGKKFDRAVAQLKAQQLAPAEHRKFLVNVSSSAADAPAPSGGGHGRLFCQLTCRFVADTPADIARHLTGRRFQAALVSYEAARASGIAFKPNTSLYAKHKKLLASLEGHAAPVDGEDGEDNDDDVAMEDPNASDSEDAESVSNEEEPAAGNSASSPPPAAAAQLELDEEPTRPARKRQSQEVSGANSARAPSEAAQDKKKPKKVPGKQSQ